MNELVEYAQLIIQFLESNGANLDIASQQALGELLQNILQVIEQDAIENTEDVSPGPVEQQEPELNKQFPSSNIHSFGYDPENGRLLVKFQGDYPQENGPTYEYGGVPQVIFDLFRKGAVPARTNGRNKWGSWWKGKNPSIGASLFTLIKTAGYPYTRLS